MRNPTQLHFPWMVSDTADKAAKDRISALLASKRRRKRSFSKGVEENWPPPMGSTVYFETPLGIQGGVLRQVRQGLVWIDYILEDDRIVPEGDLVMCPLATPWRDPSTVSEAERKVWADRIQAKVASGIDLRQDQAAWAEFCEYLMYLNLRLERKRDLEMSELRTADQRPS